MAKHTMVSYYGMNYAEHAEKDFLEMKEHGCDTVLLALTEFDLDFWFPNIDAIVKTAHKVGLRCIADTWGIGKYFGGENVSLFLQNNIYYRQVSAYTGEVLNAACFNTNSFRDYFTNLCLKLAKNTEIDGFLYGRDNDWVFVDWNVDLDTSGALCFEQILLFLALENFSRIGEALGKDAAVYKIAARKLKRRIDEVFWNEKRGVYMHSIKDGKLSENVTAYANMFAVLYGFADQKKRAKIVRALLNDKDIPAVNTPYMQTYKLSCLFELGEYDGIQNDVEFGEKFVAKPVLNLVKNASITVAMKRGKLTLKVKEDEIEVFSTDIEGTLFAFGREFSVPAGKKITCKEKV